MESGRDFIYHRWDLNLLCNLSYTSAFEPPTSISQVLGYSHVAQILDLNFFPMLSNLFSSFPSYSQEAFNFFLFLVIYHLCIYWCFHAMVPCGSQSTTQMSLFSVFSTMVMKILWISQLGANAFPCWAPFSPGIFCGLLVPKTLVPTTLELLESVSDLSVLLLSIFSELRWTPFLQIALKMLLFLRFPIDHRLATFLCGHCHVYLPWSLDLFIF